ncbi:hypothetical protein RchiOBHm_Chr5g0036481 [Rosa chinensis]|uniref:Uncharacterized protein n=1 Tax=Rosa chinensis TaxID=74649 RepID=A0A2P6QBI1_ROSCH|nr:hypothetical protein RchiOBHm_Chr5g0036481 [Rosa chinensis]
MVRCASSLTVQQSIPVVGLVLFWFDFSSVQLLSVSKEELQLWDEVLMFIY